MSKSIKASSINLGDSEEELYEKIVNCGKRNEEVILQMITLSSNWNYEEVKNAKIAFYNRDKEYNAWMNYKLKYFEFFG